MIKAQLFGLVIALLIGTAGAVFGIGAALLVSAACAVTVVYFQ